MHFINKVKNDFETNSRGKQPEGRDTTINNRKTNAQSTVLSKQNSLFDI